MTIFALPTSPQIRAAMFPELATITRPSFTQDAQGWNEPDNAPEDDPVVFADVPSQFSAEVGHTEVRNAAGEFVRAPLLLLLDGDYAVDEADAVLTRGKVFDVVAVQRDSYALVTVLHMEERRP